MKRFAILFLLATSLFAQTSSDRIPDGSWNTAEVIGIEKKDGFVEYTILGRICRLRSQLQQSEQMPKLKVGETIKYTDLRSTILLVDNEGKTYRTKFLGEAMVLRPVPPFWQSAPTNLELGTWKLNLEKSTFKPGPAPRSAIRIYEATPDGGIHFTQKGESAEGRSSVAEFTARPDGKDYPLTGSPSVNSISITNVDRYSADAVEKKDGKPMLFIHRVISQDGKTMTITSKGTAAGGRTIDNVMVFDKQ